MVKEGMKIEDYFPAYLDYLIIRGMSDKTVQENRRFLYEPIKVGVGKIKVDQLKMADVAFVEQAGRSHGRFGSQRAVVYLRRLLSFLEDSNIFVPLNWRTIKVPKVPHAPVDYLTEDELNQVRQDLIPTDKFSLGNENKLRTRAIIETLLDTGLRIGECVKLLKENINIETKEALVENIKTHEKQKVYFTNRSLDWLKKYWEYRNDNHPWAFTSTSGQVLTTQTVRKSFALYFKNINKRVHPHIFRKTLCTKLLQNGVDIKSTQTLMRHSSERTTLKYYAAVNVERCKDLHKKVMGELLLLIIIAEEWITLS